MSSKLIKQMENSSSSTQLKVMPNNPTPLDGRRVLISNIPNEINKEYLELYLEYLSDEIAVERYDFSKEFKNTLLVTFSKDIDFNRMKQKHLNRPNCLHNKTDLDQVHLPNTILIEFDDLDPKSNESIEENFNKELFELYFSNRKRSGGENITKCVYESNKSRALITYEDYEVAARVAGKSHQIKHKPVSVYLFYDKIGKDPFFTEENLSSTHSSLSTTSSSVVSSPASSTRTSTSASVSLSSEASSTKKKKSVTVETINPSFKLDRKFDPKLLSPQQCNYLIELQTIYNELNGSHLNLFKSTPPPPPIKPQLLNKKLIFKSDLQLSRSKELIKNKELYLSKEKSFSSNQIHDKKSRYYYNKSMLDSSNKRKSLPEFHSSLSLNGTQQVNNNSLEMINNLKKKTNSTQSLKKSQIKIDKKSPEPQQSKLIRSTFSSNGVNSKIKPQKIIYKNKERPPPPKIVKPSSQSSQSQPSVPPPPPPPPASQLKLSDEDLEDERIVDEVVDAIAPAAIEETKTIKMMQQTQQPEKFTLIMPISQLKKKLTQRANSMFSLNRDSSSTTTSEDNTAPIKIRKSIVKHRSLLNQSTNILQPKQTIIKFTDGSVPGEENSDNDSNDKENSCETKPLVCLSNSQKGICSRTSNKLYKANLAKRNLQSFYGPTINESLNKLTSTQIEFIQSTRYLSKLKASFPKVNINLNEKMRNLYFFGTSNQVIEAKSRVKYDLDLIKQTSYEIEQKELADYLKKPEPRQKILKFIESIINRHQYQRTGKNNKLKSLENINKSSSVNYCSYQIGLSKRDPNKNILIVNTNMDNMAQFLNKLLNESIRVNKLINIYNTDIVDYIINSDPEWSDFYDLKFKNNVDFSLVKTDSKDSNWSLKITGFKEYVDKFIIDFRNKFD